LYYGFVWVTLAWQLVYRMMWRDAIRFRPVLIPAIVGKAGFAISVFVLFAQNRLEASSVLWALIDLILAALFSWAFIALGVHTQGIGGVPPRA
jgi:hypothetical protein